MWSYLEIIYLAMQSTDFGGTLIMLSICRYYYIYIILISHIPIIYSCFDIKIKITVQTFI